MDMYHLCNEIELWNLIPKRDLLWRTVDRCSQKLALYWQRNVESFIDKFGNHFNEFWALINVHFREFTVVDLCSYSYEWHYQIAYNMKCGVQTIFALNKLNFFGNFDRCRHFFSDTWWQVWQPPVFLYLLLAWQTCAGVFTVMDQAFTSSYFLSDSSAMSLACESWASRIATRSSSILVRFSNALRILVSAGPNTCVL